MCSMNKLILSHMIFPPSANCDCAWDFELYRFEALHNKGGGSTSIRRLHECIHPHHFKLSSFPNCSHPRRKMRTALYVCSVVARNSFVQLSCPFTMRFNDDGRCESVTHFSHIAFTKPSDTFARLHITHHKTRVRAHTHTHTRFKVCCSANEATPLSHTPTQTRRPSCNKCATPGTDSSLTYASNRGDTHAHTPTWSPTLEIPNDESNDAACLHTMSACIE